MRLFFLIKTTLHLLVMTYVAKPNNYIGICYSLYGLPYRQNAMPGHMVTILLMLRSLKGLLYHSLLQTLTFTQTEIYFT